MRSDFRRAQGSGRGGRVKDETLRGRRSQLTTVKRARKDR